MPMILYFQSTGKVSTRQKLEGVYASGRVFGWDVQVIEPGATERKAMDLVRFWEPDGVIVECGSEQNHFAPRIFGKTPVVFLDRNPKTLDGAAFCVTHDSAATARIAARELLSLRPSAYAYVPWPEQRFWSDEREAGFAAALRLNGHGYARFGGKARSSNIRALQKELGTWLTDLPKPVGVFAANDVMAAHVAAAAARSGLKARDVFASFTCTRRMAEIRFRAATGKSPLEAIQEIRRAKAEELLKDPTRDRNAIANLCGYSSANALANFLRRYSARS